MKTDAKALSYAQDLIADGAAFEDALDAYLKMAGASVLSHTALNDSYLRGRRDALGIVTGFLIGAFDDK